MSELNIGDKVTVEGRGSISIVSIGKVTAKRAYASPNANVEGMWNYEFKREIRNPESLDMIGLPEYSLTSANLTTQADIDEIARRRTIIAARKFFEELVKDESKMVETYKALLAERSKE